jgi:hypothetical protein
MRMKARRLALCVGLGFALTSGQAFASGEHAEPPMNPLESLVEVTTADRAGLDQLAAKYDLAEYVRSNDDGTLTTAVYAEADELAEIKASGYELGATIEDTNTRVERIEERDQAKAEEELAHSLAENGAPKGGAKLLGRAVVPTPGELVIQRADTFTNYAGRFLYVEAHSKLGTTSSTTTANLALSYAGADGEFQTPVSMSRFTDAGKYMYHQLLVRLGDVEPKTIRVASDKGGVIEGTPKEWLGTGLPPHADGYQTGFHNRYMDPTEIYARFTLLAAEFRGLAELVNLPNKTNGYQRKAMAFMNGDASPSGGVPNLPRNPTPEQEAAYALDTSRSVVLYTKAWGHEGGDQVTAEFKVPSTPGASLSVAVTGNDVVVNLATDASGAVTSTAADVVAAINGNAAASALLTAMTYRGNMGAGVVQPRAKVSLDDYLSAPSYVDRGPFQPKALRIGTGDKGSKVGVFIYCQQHAREWATPLTCLETAERTLRNYATDPKTKELVENLDIWILPSVNPDGSHYAFHDYNSQRKNMTNYCADGGANDPGARNSWGVDLNRNSTVGSVFDGYQGASATSCTSGTFAGPHEGSEPEIKNELWIVDANPNIKFAVNIHSYGGYFMWSPGAYKPGTRETLPAPNIGIEKYFFDAGEKVLARIKEHRNTVILPERTGPIADVLYSAAGNSADDQWYRKGIISYSFETGADRFVSTEEGTQQRGVGFQPDYASEGSHEAMEFANGNYGLMESALDYAKDVTPPVTGIEFSADRATAPPINYKFTWPGEAAVIHYTTDGSTPTLASPTYNASGPRQPGEILTIDRLGIHDIKWIAVDIKGNVSPVQTQRFLIGPEGEVGGTVPPTLSITLGAPASFGAFLPGITRDYLASTTANVISTAGDATLSVADPSSTHTGHLVNGSFFLPQKLQVNAKDGAYAAVGGSSAPTAIHTYTGPVSNDQVTIGFKQSINANDGLRTGAYGKTLTFTLSTTNP